MPDISDLNIVQGGVQPGAFPFSQEPADIQASATAATQNWETADTDYWNAHEQKIGPLLGVIAALAGGPLGALFGPELAASGFLGGALSSAGGAALISGGAGALGGLLEGENPGQALLGGLEGGAGSFLGSEAGGLLNGALSGGGGAFGGVSGGGVDALSGGSEFLDTIGAPSASSFTSEFNGTTPLNALGGALGSSDSTFGSEFGGTPAPASGSVPGGFSMPGASTLGGPDATGPSGAPASTGGTDPMGGNTVDEVTVTPQTIGNPLAPALGGGLPDLTGLSGTNPLQGLVPANNNGNPTNKIVDDLLKLLGGGGGGGAGGVAAARPSGGGPSTGGGTPAPANTGSPGSPGTTAPGSSLPDLGIGGTGGVGGANPTLINKSGGGAGAGPAGVGDLKLQSSLAPDIYPWSTMGGQ